MNIVNACTSLKVKYKHIIVTKLPPARCTALLKHHDNRLQFFILLSGEMLFNDSCCPGIETYAWSSDIVSNRHVLHYLTRWISTYQTLAVVSVPLQRLPTKGENTKAT